MFRVPRATIAAIVVLLASRLNAQVVDGSITTAEYGAPALAAQNIGTAFGNNFSELDTLYGKRQPNGDLFLGLGGNLEGNGNAIVLLIDSRAGGCVVGTDVNGNGIVGSIPGQHTDDLGTDTDGSSGVSPTPGGPSRLPAGFNPDKAISMNAGGGVNYFMNIIDLTLPNDPPLAGPDNRDIFLGQNTIGGGAATQTYTRNTKVVSAGTITHAFNNSNTAGVNGFGDPTLGDPLTAVTGFEMLLSAEFLDTNLSQIGLMAFITNGGGDFISNQFLPGLGFGDNPGAASAPNDPLFDAAWFPGLTFASVPVPEPACSLIPLGVLAVVSLSRYSGRGQG